MPLIVTPDPDGLVTPNIRPPGTQLDAFTVALGDFLAGVVHTSGANVRAKNLTGWWDNAPSTGTATQRTSDHGVWLDQAHYGGRSVGLDVVIDAHSWDHVTPIIDELMAAVPLDDLTDLVVSEYDRDLVAAVRQDGDPITVRSGGRAVVSLSLIAPDPRRYDLDDTVVSTGLPLTSGGLSLPISLPVSIGATVASGRVTAVNDGNMTTRPVFTVTGPCPAFSITHIGSGRRIRTFEAVPVGRAMVLDADTRMGRLDGVALRTVTGAWFDLDPGVNEIAFSAESYDAAARLYVAYRSARR